ncbi:MAG: hypothetical protein UR85_C0004G0036 [Candidatus Nomurabacteria bacterium GW2011_GWF2_35_66]|uniref:Type 4 fimbrial biogenesis protein PilX N-terminal domain-containing protein n=1 Tax=Candidatus Nomurabacteria bacterium GW2011_GWE1_35_16 TaxID=1618761 RepID=A0A0G0BSW8_9BACT|nr:MAG: hypothetical protein UR55_C0002G0035 [Candidatus Nomurabacteria bacterium GW2011_GWF1_34_20]KKP63614.1 MAG: hypothetical protein UR57_C0002G0035 [Candidatus Nomurabacteria bacterium GW2011_GWE2_34_25]KKP66816.1 MAG: hypothetical protein UR64_C0002G0032 [Candidatus Nomurabacteria bacterium GW2011_GWE1_35_16]KKP83442.1 MAG: hypothetical protein UR85_C0004G0036 [Candidatus Nomurabacteria bacterium GW2011_GWF2_35_66]HAE36626.1 hypothetical protein [Candidatus Nomurabacteria bacterium]
MKTKNRKINNGGYAILFTVVIVGIITAITIGLSTSAYKQAILSSVARDSTTAFYQADIGSECALYAEKVQVLDPNNTNTTFTCAGTTLDFNSPSANQYTLYPQDETSLSKCFRIDVNKDISLGPISTEIVTRGYNKCKKDNIRTVERGIKITY